MQKIKDFLVFNLGIVLMSVGIYFFKFPNNFSTGGVSGIAVVIPAIFPQLSGATTMLFFNFLFLGLGFAFLNKGFGLKTVYCTVVLSLLTQFLEIYVPMASPLTNQKMLELVFSIILPAVGSALIFTSGASSGGTDIIAMILRKYTNLNIGIALLITDFFISLSTLIVFDIETCLFSMLGLIGKSFIVDIVIENISTKKIAIIITSEREKVEEFIIHTLKRGVTRWDCVGVYSGVQKTALLTALSRGQAIELRSYVKAIDDKSFIVINSSPEVIGKGFARGI
ncbi:MAG: YitT family protein [Clostridia bacterium]